MQNELRMNIDEQLKIGWRQAVGSLALVLRCLEAALQLPQVCSQELMGKRFDGCHSVLALNLNSTNE